MLNILLKYIEKKNKQYNQNRIYGFIFNSLPKAGTHLVCKALDNIPGICCATGAEVRAPDGFGHDQELMKKEKSAMVGIVTPLRCPVSIIEKKITLIKKGQYSAWHVPFSDEMKELFLDHKIKLVLSMRDPRDVIVSQYFYALSRKNHLLHELYNKNDIHSCLAFAINGIKPEDYDGRYHTTIAERLEQIVLWMDNYDSHCVKFEDLIGSRGGGNLEKQVHTFRALCEYLNIKCSKRVCLDILKNLFGGTNTFRKGIPGDWRNHFSKNNIENFKEVAGDMLIKLGYEQDNNW